MRLYLETLDPLDLDSALWLTRIAEWFAREHTARPSRTPIVVDGIDRRCSVHWSGARALVCRQLPR